MNGEDDVKTKMCRIRDLVIGCSKDEGWPMDSWMEIASDFRDIVDNNECYHIPTRYWSFAEALVGDVIEDVLKTECGCCESVDSCRFVSEKINVATRLMGIGLVYGFSMALMLVASPERGF